jgi:SHS family lactate transporter-like MFS transporter
MGLVGFVDYFATAFRFAMTTYVREDLTVSFGVLVGMTRWVFLVSCLSLLPRALADIYGRRVILLVTLVMLCIGQWAVGLAATPGQYVALLAVLSIFYKSDIWLIVISEEAPARRRGLIVSITVGVGISGAFLLGHLVRGMGTEPGAWREIATFPIWGIWLALPLLLFLRDTAYFRRRKAPPAPRKFIATLLAPFGRETIKALVRLSLLKMTFVGGMFVTIILIGSEFLRVEHGFNPDQVGRVVQLEVIASILGTVVAGSLSDRFGRRGTFNALGFIFAAAVGVLAFLPRGDSLVVPAYVIQSFAGTAINTILRIVTLEILPTGCRSTGAGWTDVFTTLFAAGTATLIGWATSEITGGVSFSTILLAVSVLSLPSILLYAGLRETCGEDLSDGQERERVATP